jgi:hypothetical protein
VPAREHAHADEAEPEPGELHSRERLVWEEPEAEEDREERHGGLCDRRDP